MTHHQFLEGSRANGGHYRVDISFSAGNNGNLFYCRCVFCGHSTGGKGQKLAAARAAMADHLVECSARLAAVHREVTSQRQRAVHIEAHRPQTLRGPPRLVVRQRVHPWQLVSLAFICVLMALMIWAAANG